MKKANVNVEIAKAMNESKKTKGFHVANVESTEKVQPTKKETKQTFVSYIVSKEEISVSKFFRLLNNWKTDDKNGYTDFCTAYNLAVNETYDFNWFIANCPKDENGNFAKWTKVSDKVAANKDNAFNRVTEKGVIYTIVAYVSLKADYLQFMQMFLNVVANVKRLQREKVAAENKAKKEAAKKEAENKQHEKNMKTVNEIFAEIESLGKNYGVPFDTAISIYESVKKANYSKELKEMLTAKAAEKKAA